MLLLLQFEMQNSFEYTIDDSYNCKLHKFTSYVSGSIQWQITILDFPEAKVEVKKYSSSSDFIFEEFDVENFEKNKTVTLKIRSDEYGMKIIHRDDSTIQNGIPKTTFESSNQGFCCVFTANSDECYEPIKEFLSNVTNY